jgi:NAD(P)-dependent dehydrogenase (short-subunit alcohol dehydrogenase family)
VAVVTGGSSGIGLATAALLAQEGARVFVTGRHEDELTAAATRLGHGVTAVPGDVTETSDLDRLYATVERDAGHIDILFANAGAGSLAPLGAVTEELVDDIFNLNVKGLLFTVQKALPLLKDGSFQKALPLLKDGSSIVLNASMSASKGMAGFGVYAASKAAVRSFARTWAVDLKERKIRVNAVSAGVIPTRGYENAGLTREQIEGFAAQMAPLIPLGRVGSPEEVATAVLYLASPDASFVNGAELFVDGGMAQV